MSKESNVTIDIRQALPMIREAIPAKYDAYRNRIAFWLLKRLNDKEQTGDLSSEKDMQFLVKEIVASFLGKALEVIEKYPDWDDEIYADIYQRIKSRVDKGDSWEDIFTTDIYADDPLPNEIFVRLVEEIYKTEIKDAKHLRKLTGLDNELIDELENTLVGARENKYMRSLEKTIKNGGKYKDLLRIEPKSFKLPNKWIGFFGKPMDKLRTIKQAVFFTFNLNESDLYRPDLRDVSEYLVLCQLSSVG